MIKIKNKLVREQKLPEADEYTVFGWRQLKVINPRIEEWLAKQSFAQDAVLATFKKMEISGNSNYYFSASVGELADSVQWDLRFAPLRPKPPRQLRDALLLIDRLPDFKLFNSEPSFSKTEDYIHINVQNGEQGWVQHGAFPANVHLHKRLEPDGIMNTKTITEPVYTDIKREAEAGFKAAFEWAKFRSMALACSDYLNNCFKQEIKKHKGDFTHNDYDRMRSRKEEVYRIMLELFPDTRIRSGKTALRQYYRPGYLEAELARELEAGIRLRFGRPAPDEERNISIIYGKPIEIISTHGEGAYNARMNFEVQTYSAMNLKEDEAVRASIEDQLGKHFNVSVKEPSKMDVTLELTDAHKIVEQIKEGKDNTYLHTQARFLLEAVKETYSLVKHWNDDKMPMLEKGFKLMVDTSKTDHFSKLTNNLNDVIRKYEVKN